MKKIIEMQNMDAPLLEYNEQIPREFEPEKGSQNQYQSESRNYSNNWNFVRELEIIKMYYEKQGRELPEKV